MRFVDHDKQLDVNVTISVDDELIHRASKQAETLGSSVNRLVREYLENLTGAHDLDAQKAEFERLSGLSRGNSRGWKRQEFRREGRCT